MTDILVPAALYPASTRLLVALVLAAVFGLASPRRSPRPLALAVVSLIVLGWSFGATLIWGTGGPSKLRWGLELNVWEGAALLGLAAVGVLAAGAALRCFAHARRRAGCALATVFAGAFTGWSVVVRYSVTVAILVVGVGIAALIFAGTTSSPPQATGHEPASTPSTPHRAERWLWNLVAAALPLLAGPIFYWWLKVSPKTWIDQACGLPGWLPLTFIPFLAVPGVTAWIRTRTVGRSREAAAAAVVVAATVTVAGCILAFLMWFGVNQCGE